MPNSHEHVPAEVLAASVVAQPKPKAKPKAKSAPKPKAEAPAPAPEGKPAGVYWDGEKYVSASD